MFFVKTCFLFVKNLILPAERNDFFEKQKTTTKNNKIKVAKLLTYGSQVIDPTAYIYIYMGETPTGGYFLAKDFNFPNFIVKKWPKNTPTKLWVFLVSLLLCAVILTYKDGHGLQHRFF